MAGSFGSSGEDELIAGINITPLVDVVLVLLVIFMITAPALYPSTLKVELPKAKSGEQAQKSPLNFTINKEGNLLWNKDALDWSMLQKRLSALGESATQQTAMISADQNTPHGTVIRLMDALRQAGITHFALNVETPAVPGKL